MFPQFAKADTSWEGHLGGAITGFLCSIAFINHGPHKTDPFANEDEEEEEEFEELQEENRTNDTQLEDNITDNPQRQ